MKSKILAILVLAVFIISMVPLALADKGSDNSGPGSSNSGRDADGVTAARLSDDSVETDDRRDEGVEVETGIDMNSGEVKLAIEKALAAFPGTVIKVEKESEDGRPEIKVRVMQADGKRVDVRVDAASGEIVRTKPDNRGKGNAKDRKAVNVKERLSNTGDKILTLIESLKDRIDALNPEDEAELLASLDEEATKVEDIQKKIDDLPENATKEEFKELAQELKSVWNESRTKIRVHATRMMALGFERVLDKAENLENKLDATLARLEENGFDVAKADAKVAEFKGHISEARANFGEASKLLGEFRADTSKEGAVQAIQEKMKEAKKHLQLAQQSLREAVKEIKAQKDGAKILKEEVNRQENPAEQEAEQSNASLTA